MFSSHLTGEILRGNLAVAMHQNHERLGVFVLHDERLDHHVIIDSQFLGTLGCTAVRNEVIRMELEIDFVRLKPVGCGRRAHMLLFCHLFLPACVLFQAGAGTQSAFPASTTSGQGAISQVPEDPRRSRVRHYGAVPPLRRHLQSGKWESAEKAG